MKHIKRYLRVCLCHDPTDYIRTLQFVIQTSDGGEWMARQSASKGFNAPDSYGARARISYLVHVILQRAQSASWQLARTLCEDWVRARQDPGTPIPS